METDLKGDTERLDELLPRFPRLLIEGQPGAGKTTFLRFVSCMLARDALGIPCPEGNTWRAQYLGLKDDQVLPTPVLLRLANLVPLFAKVSATRRDNHRWLLDLLVQICEQNGYDITRTAWKTLLRNGQAMLLLDGRVTDMVVG